MIRSFRSLKFAEIAVCITVDHTVAAIGDCFAMCELLGFATIFVYVNNEIINATNQMRIIIMRCNLTSLT